MAKALLPNVGLLVLVGVVLVQHILVVEAAKLPQCGLIDCADIYKPVCACPVPHGRPAPKTCRTYPNECGYLSAKSCGTAPKNAKITDGKCSEELEIPECGTTACTFDYNPLCVCPVGSTDPALCQEFGNKCALKDAQECGKVSRDATVNEGECPKPAEPTNCNAACCSQESNPVCACLSTDSSICRSFLNKCLLDATNCVSRPGYEVAPEESCAPKCGEIMCPALYDPVCACPGPGRPAPKTCRTYSNSCAFGAAQLCGTTPKNANTTKGACSEELEIPQCGLTACNKVYQPFCACPPNNSDPALCKTYGNDCTLDDAKECGEVSPDATVYEGECPTVCGQTICPEIYLPYCACEPDSSDCQQYSNECRLEDAQKCGEVPEDAVIEQRECSDTVEPTCDESHCPEDSNTVCACLSTDSSICQTFPNQCVLDARNCLSKPGYNPADDEACASEPSEPSEN